MFRDEEKAGTPAGASQTHGGVNTYTRQVAHILGMPGQLDQREFAEVDPYVALDVGTPLSLDDVVAARWQDEELFVSLNPG